MPFFVKLFFTMAYDFVKSGMLMNTVKAGKTIFAQLNDKKEEYKTWYSNQPKKF